RAAMRTVQAFGPGGRQVEWTAHAPAGDDQAECPAFRRADGRLFAFAGLWECWQPPGGPAVESCTIPTTQANDLGRAGHERRPGILDPAAYDAWLDPAVDGKALSGWLRPLPAELLVAVPVLSRVNSPRNEGPECL